MRTVALGLGALVCLFFFQVALVTGRWVVALILAWAGICLTHESLTSWLAWWEVG